MSDPKEVTVNPYTPEKEKAQVTKTDPQSYFLGEVPQKNLVDPMAELPLGSDRLIGETNVVEKLLFDAGALVEEEVAQIQKHQKRIAYWEDRIEKNRTLLKQNELRIKQNTQEGFYDKKNRDYWHSRSEDVERDYAHTEVAGRFSDWSFLIKKYGLKNIDGTEINPKAATAPMQCAVEAKALASRYMLQSAKYETARKEKEAENTKLIGENVQLMSTNETLTSYITNAYTTDIEPLQDGVLLLKEFSLKLKGWSQQPNTTYDLMRTWAESFLDSFLRTNPRAPQRVVTLFRTMASIPLPPEYC
jgi:hypothetical protein